MNFRCYVFLFVLDAWSESCLWQVEKKKRSFTRLSHTSWYRSPIILSSSFPHNRGNKHSYNVLLLTGYTNQTNAATMSWSLKGGLLVEETLWPTSFDARATSFSAFWKCSLHRAGTADASVGFGNVINFDRDVYILTSLFQIVFGVDFRDFWVLKDQTRSSF